MHDKAFSVHVFLKKKQNKNNASDVISIFICMCVSKLLLRRWCVTNVLFSLQDPLLDTSVLDELKDCLSDDLWSSPDLQLLTGHPSTSVFV